MDFPLEMALTQFNRQDLKHAKKEEKEIINAESMCVYWPNHYAFEGKKVKWSQESMQKIRDRFHVFVSVVCIYYLYRVVVAVVVFKQPKTIADS